MNSRTMGIVKRIAFVAHDDKKADLIEWSYFNKELLRKHEIIATGMAGDILEGTVNQSVCKLLSGPLGGYQEITTMIAEGKVDALIFFWKETETQSKQRGILDLLRVALSANIIVACNKTTADFIFTSDLMNKEHSIPVVGDTAYSPIKTYQKNNKSKSAISITL